MGKEARCHVGFVGRAEPEQCTQYLERETGGGIICVVGDQGAGKSTFFRLLAVEDEWFTDDLKDLESGKVFEKLQGHWIIELSEMLATNNARSNEAIKSFLSRQKEIYRTPYNQYLFAPTVW